jgi:DnaB-like helicase C terminal domain/Toprim-like
MTINTYNHKAIFKDFLDRSNIIELYKSIGGTEPITMANGQVSAHAFWRGDKKRSLSLTVDQDRAYDFAEAKGYNSYSLAVESLGSKDEAYLAMCRVANLEINDYIRKSKNTNVQINNSIKVQMYKGTNTLPEFYQLSSANKAKIKTLRGINFEDLNPSQKSNIVQDKDGMICLLYKLKGETKLYQRWNPESTDYKYLVGKGTTPKDTFALAGLNTLKAGEDLWIVEGFFDMICMQLSGFNCVSKFNARGNSELVAQWLAENQSSFKDIYIALDNDKDGLYGTQSLITQLGHLKYSKTLYTANLRLPEGIQKYDPNEIWETGRKVEAQDFEIKKINLILDTPQLEKTEKVEELKKPAITTLPILSWSDIANFKEAELVHNQFNLPIEKQAMTLVCALSGHGKTTAILNLAVGIAQAGQKVLYIMLEERPLTILAKLQSIYLNHYTDEITYKRKDYNLVGYHTKIIKVKEGEEEIQMPGKAFEEFKSFQDIINEKQIAIMDATSQDVDMIANSIAGAFEENYYDAVLIDYIQNIRPSPDKQSQIRQVQLAGISSILAPLAIKHDTALIVGAQFRRDINSLDELDLAKIREAGDIGQDSHMAIGIWNYSDPTKNQGVALKDEVTMRCLKNRGNRFKDIRVKVKHMHWECEENITKDENGNPIKINKIALNIN